MFRVTAHPKKTKNHVVAELFKTRPTAESWRKLLRKNGWVVGKVEQVKQ